jgi:hypothetical protein
MWAVRVDIHSYDSEPARILRPAVSWAFKSYLSSTYLFRPELDLCCAMI